MGPANSHVNGQTFTLSMHTLLFSPISATAFNNSNTRSHQNTHYKTKPVKYSQNTKTRDANLTTMATVVGFDQLPDSLILLIFNCVFDVKTLIRCRSVCKQFNTLVPQTEFLSLKVDQVISTEPDDYDDSVIFNFFKSFFRSLQELITTATIDSIPEDPTRTRVVNSPARILTQFERIKRLRIELPGGDLSTEKGMTVKWRAEFGRCLKNFVIVGFKLQSENPGEGGQELKKRVMWTISALIAASARHLMLEEIVRGHGEMEELVLVDREGEGRLVMDKEGMREWRAEDGAHVSNRAVVVPNVRMQMRHEPRLLLDDGVWLEGATLVLVTPSVDVDDDAKLALQAFGGANVDGGCREIVQRLLETRSFMLEINS